MRVLGNREWSNYYLLTDLPDEEINARYLYPCYLICAAEDLSSYTFLDHGASTSFISADIAFTKSIEAFNFTSGVIYNPIESINKSTACRIIEKYWYSRPGDVLWITKNKDVQIESHNGKLILCDINADTLPDNTSIGLMIVDNCIDVVECFDTYRALAEFENTIKIGFSTRYSTAYGLTSVLFGDTLDNVSFIDMIEQKIMAAPELRYTNRTDLLREVEIMVDKSIMKKGIIYTYNTNKWVNALGDIGLQIFTDVGKFTDAKHGILICDSAVDDTSIDFIICAKQMHTYRSVMPHKVTILHNFPEKNPASVIYKHISNYCEMLSCGKGVKAQVDISSNWITINLGKVTQIRIDMNVSDTCTKSVYKKLSNKWIKEDKKKYTYSKILRVSIGGEVLKTSTYKGALRELLSRVNEPIECISENSSMLWLREHEYNNLENKKGYSLIEGKGYAVPNMDANNTIKNIIAINSAFDMSFEMVVRLKNGEEVVVK